MTRNYRNVKNYRLRIKDIVIYSMGEKCQICEYNNCKAALEVHHLDPNVKEYSINEIKSWDKMCAELPKCILLCANCHREVHFNGLDIPKNYSKFDINLAIKLKKEQALIGKQAGIEALIKTRRRIKEEKLIIKTQNELKETQERKELVEKSNINFSEFGWGIELGKLFGISKQDAGVWLKKNMPEVYYSDYIKKYPKKKSKT